MWLKEINEQPHLWPSPPHSVYLDVELDVDHPDGLACVEAPDPDGGILAAGDHKLWRHVDTSHLQNREKF